MELAEAQRLKVGDKVHFEGCTFRIGPRGTEHLQLFQGRVSSIKTWNMHPGRVFVKVRFGLRRFFTFDEFDISRLHTDATCLALAEREGYLNRLVAGFAEETIMPSELAESYKVVTGQLTGCAGSKVGELWILDEEDDALRQSIDQQAESEVDVEEDDSEPDDSDTIYYNASLVV